MQPLTAAVAQIEVVSFDVDKNAERAVEAIAEAADRGATLVVLPELVNTGYVAAPEPGFMARFWEAADPVDGEFTQRMRQAAVHHGVHVIVGIAERHPVLTGVLRNVSLLVTPEGVCHRRTKLHIPRLEKHYFEEGSSLAPVDTTIARVGLLVCADNSFPEAARVMALKGVEVLAVSYSAAAPPNDELYRALTLTRAYENQIFAVATNRVGSQGGVTFGGGSTIAAPDGTVLACLGAEAGLALAELDPALIVSERLRQTRFRDRRPDLYGGLSGTSPAG